MGMFTAVIIAAAVSTDDTYLHSWGSIFVQDVLMPFRKRPLSHRAQMWLLRLAIVGVAIFAFTFSLLFPLNEYIFMYFQITGAIYLGGAGAVILGGLYWKRGTVEGAWAAMICGSVLSVTGVTLRNIVWPFYLSDLKARFPDAGWIVALPGEFPYNGMEMAFAVALICIVLYVVVSLLSRRPPIDMDRLLHRGRWAVETEGHQPRQTDTPVGSAPDPAPPPHATWRHRFWRRLGVGKDFTAGDKAIYVFKIVWTMFFFTVFIVGTLAAAFIDIPESLWIRWWGVKVALSVAVGIGATVWFLLGGVRDLVVLIRELRHLKRDQSDDGMVRGDEHLQES